MSEPVMDPGPFVRQYRSNYVNLHALWTHVTGVPEGAELRSPADRPLQEADLPEPIRRLLQAFREAHPGVDLTLEKYQRLVNGRPTVVVEDDSDLPAEEELVVFSNTTSTTASDVLEVVSDVLVARRAGS
jgi:hypothetical protein